MLSKSRIVIAVILIAILFAGASIKGNLFSYRLGRVEITQDEIEIKTISNPIILFRTAESSPFVEIKSNDKIIKRFGIGDSKSLSSKYLKGTFHVGIPNNFNSVSLSTVSAGIKGNLNVKEINVNSVSGNIELEVEQIKDLNIKNVSGKIKLNNSSTKDFEINNVSGTVEIGDYKAENGDIKTVSGKIDIKTNLSSLNYDVKTNGSFNTDISSDDNSVNKLTIHSAYGKISLHK